ncbi:hypothetical protein [Sinorhizobium medicae]|uniref:hypothetical protein n=1 Tax=Sinorhizobium medicae TaxID=110321 RepID=UPI000C7B6656|nr:hypothetical protein [Sinorhizobium medicae]PLT95023.1 hypothetical protein BMJ32_30575 [Sinorhizobium medicae]PLU56787.1 hypothetical protein BMJ23_12620 [Sinorhizobium medicae]PLU75168.1 hypothetical protein BMJ21_01845 [Sinorhizobium medicae]PLU82638.1 hypothetical protein BMJ22_10905 [Sinorhizobium medicae]
MADQAVVHFGENSPEEIAYKLMIQIANVEKKFIGAADNVKEGWQRADREYLLQTYAQCINTVRTAHYG